MTIESRTLQIELLDYWHVGSGKGRGSHLDAIVDRDSQKLPYIPGKMVKGVLRQAVHCLESWGHCKPDTTKKMFGAREESGDGSIFISDARLSKDVADYLAQEEQAEYRQQLFAEYFSTAVEHASGSALDKSLRGIELVVPCCLQSEITLSNASVENGFEVIKQALPLIRAIGAHRSRGLGRCNISIEEVAR